MRVDETGCHDQTVRVERTRRHDPGALGVADEGDPVTGDGNVRKTAGSPSPIDDGSAANEQVGAR